MPLSTVAGHRLVERVRGLRATPARAYGVALLVVAVATIGRYLIDPQLLQGLPFITYYPAVLIAALLGGLGPGIMALLLSSLGAVYLFLPPFGSFELEPRGVISVLFFLAFSGLNIAIVVALDRTIDRLIAQERNIRTIIESAPNGVVIVDQAGRIMSVNTSTETLFGYGRTELLGRPVEMLVPKPAAERHRTLRVAYQARPEPRSMGAGRDLSGRRKDGSEFPVEIGLNPVGGNGKPFVLATVIDITTRRRAERGQQLLVDELRHRTRNLFAVVQSLAAATLFKDTPPAEAKDTFYGRLQALAHAYAAVADTSWEGAALDQMLRRQLAGFSDRVSVTGCGVAVGVSAAQNFALIAHELATNAVKYGALSAPGGTVAITGQVGPDDGPEGRVLSFCWQESGGPKVSPPTRRGFGSTLLVDAARGFSTDVAIEYNPDGLVYRLDVPLRAIEPSMPPLAELNGGSDAPRHG